MECPLSFYERDVQKLASRKGEKVGILTDIGINTRRRFSHDERIIAFKPAIFPGASPIFFSGVSIRIVALRKLSILEGPRWAVVARRSGIAVEVAESSRTFNESRPVSLENGWKRSRKSEIGIEE